jgi:Zn-dependent M28 family amino/carboxypeptidase
MPHHLLLAAALAATALSPAPLAAAPTSPNAVAIPEARMPIDPRFSAERIKADVAFLADDVLKGRETGSPEYEIAARFVAQRFAALGLIPKGDDGGWLQRVPFQRAVPSSAPAGATLTGAGAPREWINGKDILISTSRLKPTVDVSAAVVFVGYGLADQRLGIDDYAGLDVKGKFVAVLSGFPAGMSSEEGAYASDEKAKVASDRGAIGMITLPTEASDRVATFARRADYLAVPRFATTDAAGQPELEAPGLQASATLNEISAAALFTGARSSYAKVRSAARGKGAVAGFALGTALRLRGGMDFTAITSPNIVAMIPGSDPALRGEYVVLSGHLDHIGVNPAKAGDTAATDRINNGAMDNAAGVATLLEVARVMSEDLHRPRRSVLFVVTTAEEKGLLGADYFARHPTVPIKAIVGNVDLDMPLLTYPFTDVVAYGADHSSLGAITRQALAPMNVSLAPDPEPEQGIFTRSDHYMFVKQGVPAVFLSTGRSNGGEPAWSSFFANNYHRPADDMNQAFDWRAGARFAEANWRITRAMADGAEPPRWLAGDPFGDIFAPGAPRARP